MTSTVSAKSVFRQPLIANRVFGMLLFVFVEMMFFSALFSAYFVIKKGRTWELPDSVLLQRAATGFNTLVLLASAVVFVLAVKSYASHRKPEVLRAGLFMVFSLSVLFLAFQIYLVAQLVVAGLTMYSSIFGACYFLLVGAHLVHVTIGVVMLGFAWLRSAKPANLSSIQSLLIYWLFVAGIWPLIYAEIYF